LQTHRAAALHLFPQLPKIFFSCGVFAAIGLAVPGMARALEAGAAPPAVSTALSGDSASEVPFAPGPAIAGSVLQTAPAQETAGQQSTPDSAPPATARIDIQPSSRTTAKQGPESEIAVEGMLSYGNWQIFAAGIHEELYTAGFEYDRNSWGHWAGAQLDYAADFLPLVLLKEPATLNPYGVRRSAPGDNIIVPGLAFSPIGLRMQWFHNRRIKPYFTVLGGAIGFTQKALSPDASYYDFTLHESIGFYWKMTERLDMRVGLFGDFHFSNAYITSYNPGLDVMNSQLALSYHLPRRTRSR
jgi:hypothetical protein